MTASLQKGINALKEVIDAPVASFFSSCVHCGLCAEACLFYTETGDPRYTPIHKLEPLKRVYQQEYTLLGRLAKMTGLSKPVTDEELEDWSELVYDSCTLCGRCSMVCPVGNDLTYMIRKLREGMAVSGHAPEGIINATKRTVDQGGPMGLKWPAVQNVIKHQEADSGLAIPVDQAGVEYLVLLSSMEIVNYPEYLGALAKIFNKAGISWTLSSEAYEATNAGIQIGASDLAREIVSRIVNAAEKLGVKKVLSPECGHAYMAIRWEGPNLMGRPYKFEVVHVLELLDELRGKGVLKMKDKLKTPVTLHDPCQIVRRGGVLNAPEALVKEAVVE
ncbi:MAG: (Fe-S)-binding protein, partial [Rubrivivax sp.]|nr:(Fe-S)-binding protein [Rubrivivax sp.]